ncbi:TRAP transporter substrate-binding protein [Sphaerochaeta halotolerans]|jgi:tripartite ATP-independent transporter DctP family solute receptor|uniref:TRAP transporter substrate-binding protein n=1 Tax=Sphaerochaeta halotolerans TaxID=2293840 RepID=UPI00136AFFA3|nr:TRAP transporter substrate-binding protein [Sphaerochaeta halotolerans]MXI87685.1 DctP family TRAP transporter solute-binding subunit [Sphaerochaeta halotolerans]
MKRVVFIALVLTIVFFACHKEESSYPELVLRYADNQSDGYPTVEAAKYLAELVKERTDGKIEIRIYPDSALGSENSVMEQMFYGGIDMSRFSLGTLSQFFPELWTLHLPYLYTDSDHMWRVLDGEIGDMYLGEMEGKGLVGLAWYDAGARSFYTRTPISSIASLEGMTIRVLENDMMSRIIALLGAEAVQIPYGDVYSMLQKLRIDGAENNLPSYVFTGHYQAAPYFYQDEHFRLPEVVMMSVYAQEKVAAVDPSFVEVMRACAKESGLYERKLWQEEEKKAYEEAVQSGVKFTIPSEEDLLALRKAMDPLYQELGEKEREIVERIGET